ncbi:MAG TPA: hypothetical protein VFX24_04820 [Ktedonobacterales bacterium]|jgi:hypothetical protein|nr:hypothetical protein [Ktedonobacterales bacterium]
MSDPSHREFMRNLNMQRDKVWAAIRDEVKGKTLEQLSPYERYAVGKEAHRQIEKLTELDVGQDGPSTSRHRAEVMHEVNALLGGYRRTPDPRLDRTKVIRIAEAILNEIFNYKESKKKNEAAGDE